MKKYFRAVCTSVATLRTTVGKIYDCYEDEYSNVFSWFDDQLTWDYWGNSNNDNNSNISETLFKKHFSYLDDDFSGRWVRANHDGALGILQFKKNDYALVVTRGNSLKKGRHLKLKDGTDFWSFTPHNIGIEVELMPEGFIPTHYLETYFKEEESEKKIFKISYVSVSGENKIAEVSSQSEAEALNTIKDFKTKNYVLQHD